MGMIIIIFYITIDTVEYVGRVSADTRPIPDQHLSRHLTASQPTLDRHLARLLDRNLGRDSFDITVHTRPSSRLTLDRLSTGISAVTRPILDRHLGLHSTNISADTSLTSRPTLNRHLDRHSTDISVYTQPTYRPILNRHLGQHSTDISADTRPQSALRLG